jgi:hypothetical protein
MERPVEDGVGIPRDALVVFTAGVSDRVSVERMR